MAHRVWMTEWLRRWASEQEVKGSIPDAWGTYPKLGQHVLAAVTALPY